MAFDFVQNIKDCVLSEKGLLFSSILKQILRLATGFTLLVSS